MSFLIGKLKFTGRKVYLRCPSCTTCIANGCNIIRFRGTKRLRMTASLNKPL